MNKNILQSAIDKYYLEGLIETVNFDINNNVLNVKFISPAKNLIGNLYCPIDLPDSSFKINNTTQLNRLINILEDEILIEKKQIKQGFDCLWFKDSKYELEYILADNSLTQQIPKINEPVYGIEFNLDEKQLKDLIIAKKALDSEIVVVDCQDSDIIFNIGGDIQYNNKIQIKYPFIKNEYIPGIDLKFNINYIKSIFNVNKDLKEGKCFINEEGLMKLLFKSSTDIDVKYFLVAEQ